MSSLPFHKMFSNASKEKALRGPSQISEQEARAIRHPQPRRVNSNNVDGTLGVQGKRAKSDNHYEKPSFLSGVDQYDLNEVLSGSQRQRHKSSATLRFAQQPSTQDTKTEARAQNFSAYALDTTPTSTDTEGTFSYDTRFAA